MRRHGCGLLVSLFILINIVACNEQTGVTQQSDAVTASSPELQLQQNSAVANPATTANQSVLPINGSDGGYIAAPVQAPGFDTGNVVIPVPTIIAPPPASAPAAPVPVVSAPPPAPVPAPIPAPAANLACDTEPVSLDGGAQAELHWNLSNWPANLNLNYRIVADQHGDPGTVEVLGSGDIRYTAPAATSEDRVVQIFAETNVNPLLSVYCQVILNHEPALAVQPIAVPTTSPVPSTGAPDGGSISAPPPAPPDAGIVSQPPAPAPAPAPILAMPILPIITTGVLPEPVAPAPPPVIVTSGVLTEPHPIITGVFAPPPPVVVAPPPPPPVVVVPPTPLMLSCDTQNGVAQAGQTIALHWSIVNSPANLALTYQLSSPGAASSALGQVTQVSPNDANYLAPAHIATAMDVSVIILANAQVASATCIVHLVADQAIGVADDGYTKGLVGNVYPLPVNTPKIPDFSKINPVQRIVVSNLDIPARNFTAGFPGVTGLFEWFGIRFDGRLYVSNDSCFAFGTTSDDGAIMYLDGNMILNNDGVHPPQWADASVCLSKGYHTFRLDYFQGPRYQIALQLYWRDKATSQANQYTIIPPEAFSRPSDGTIGAPESDSVACSN